MTLNLESILAFIESPLFTVFVGMILGYLGLLWLCIIIWVTRDALHRSGSLLFQTCAIVLNLAAPFLGVLLYLIIRPSKTTRERYYEELEERVLENLQEEKAVCRHCKKMLTETDLPHKKPLKK